MNHSPGDITEGVFAFEAGEKDERYELLAFTSGRKGMECLISYASLPNEILMSQCLDFPFKITHMML